MSAAAPASRAPDPTLARPAQDGEGLLTSHVRGSSLMLVGRLLAMLLSFVTQVIVVRHLAKGDYGVLAYGLSVALLLQSLLPLGMNRSDTRFLAMYDERRDPARLLGVIVLEAATVIAFGAAAIAAALVFRDALETSLGFGATGFAVLLAMLALAPVHALDTLVINVFAVFAKPWAVFFRRYVLDPVLRLVVAILLVALDGGVMFVAVGFVAAGLLGLAIYSGMLVRLLRRLGVLTAGCLRSMVVPVREVLVFSLPLLLTNVVAVGAIELAAVFLGHYRPAAEVAAFRAIEPFAALNFTVLYSFTTLFTPAAARLYARGDRAGLRRLYWQSASWVAVLTFPILCLTTALAEPLTLTAYGDRYADSALYLALLSVGYYVNAALGFNGITVLMLGRIRYLTIGNLVVLAFMVGVNFLLIPRWGAMGAVVAVLASMLVHNAVKQGGLGFGAGIGVFDRGHMGIAVILLVIGGAATVVSVVTAPSLVVGMVVVAVLGIALLRLFSPALELAATFPELTRIPVLRLLLR